MRDLRQSVGALVVLGVLLSAMLGGEVMAAGDASATSMPWTHRSWNMMVSAARDPTLARARRLHVVVAPAPNIPTDWMPVACLADLVGYQFEFVPRPLPLLRVLLPFVPRNKAGVRADHRVRRHSQCVEERAALARSPVAVDARGLRPLAVDGKAT